MHSLYAKSLVYMFISNCLKKHFNGRQHQPTATTNCLSELLYDIWYRSFEKLRRWLVRAAPYPHFVLIPLRNMQRASELNYRQKSSISFVNSGDPPFIRQIKEKLGYVVPATIDDKVGICFFAKSSCFIYP